MSFFLVFVCQNSSFHFFPSLAFSFSSQYLLLFLKSSRSCVLLIPTPFTSAICPSTESWILQFLLRIWPTQLTFLRWILFRSDLFSPKCLRTYSLVTLFFYFIFSILIQHNISKLSKYFHSNFLSVQDSEPCKPMLQT